MADRSQSRSVAAGAAANWLAFAAAMAVGFLLRPVMMHHLGRARYDVWVVVDGLLAYLTLLDGGIAVSLVRHVARHHATADPAGLNRVASSCLAVFTAAGLVALALGGAGVLLVGGRLEAQAGHPGDVRAFMLVMLAAMAASLPLGVFGSILDGLGRFPEKSAVRLVTLAGRTAGLVLAVRGGGGLLAVGAVVGAAAAAEQLVLAGLCYRFLPGLSLRPRFIDRAALRTVGGSSRNAFLAMLAGRVTGQTGAVVAGLVLPPGSATFFATGGQLVEYAKNLLRTVTTTLTPGVSAMEARGDFAGIRRLFLGATRAVVYAAVPVNVGLWWFGGPFLTRWVGPDDAAGSLPTAHILAATLTTGIAQSVAARVLYGLGRLTLFARLALAEAAANVALTAALIGPFGVEGVAVGVAGPNVVCCVLVVAHAARVVGVRPREYLAAWAKPLAAAAVPVAVWAALGTPAAAWPDIFACGLAGLVPYAAVVAGVEWRWGRRTSPPGPPFASERGRPSVSAAQLRVDVRQSRLAPPLPVSEGGVRSL